MAWPSPSDMRKAAALLATAAGWAVLIVAAAMAGALEEAGRMRESLASEVER